MEYVHFNTFIRLLKSNEIEREGNLFDTYLNDQAIVKYTRKNGEIYLAYECDSMTKENAVLFDDEDDLNSWIDEYIDEQDLHYNHASALNIALSELFGNLDDMSIYRKLHVAEGILDRAAAEYLEETTKSIEQVKAYAEACNTFLTDEEAEHVRTVCDNVRKKRENDEMVDWYEDVESELSEI